MLLTTDWVVLAGFIAASIIVSFVLKGTLHAFLLPFALAYSFWIEIGTRWTPAKIVPFLLILGLLARTFVGKPTLAFGSIPKWAVILFATLVFSTVFNMELAGLAPAQNLDNSRILQSPQWRASIQVVSYAVIFLYYVVPKASLKKLESFPTFFRVYLWASTSLCVYGIYQLFAYYNDLPFRGVIYAPGVEGLGSFDVLGATIPRLNSLANEPKQLSLFLLPSIVILILVKTRAVKTLHSKFFGWWNLLLHCFVCGFTFATSAFFAVPLIVLAVSVLVLKRTTRRALQFALVFVLVGAFAVASLAQVLKNVQVEAVPVEDVLAERTIRMLEQRRLDHIVFQYLADNPRYFFLGMGPGNYSFVVDDEGAPLFGAHGIDPIDSGLLTLLADVGVVGLVAVLLLALKPVWANFILRLHLLKANPLRADVILLSSALSVTALCQMPFVGALPHLLMFAGVAGAAAKANRRLSNP
ncbi:MAG: O-antigen ligase family protein [Pyrinomonadaceae bacterium]